MYRGVMISSLYQVSRKFVSWLKNYWGEGGYKHGHDTISLSSPLRY
jgi:hypothetical protein